MWLRRVVYVLGASVAVGVAWLVVTGVLAERAATRAEHDLSSARQLIGAGNSAQLDAVTRDLGVQAQRAHHLTTGPVWWTAAHVPFLGRPILVVRGAAEAGNGVASEVVAPLAAVEHQLNPATLRVNGNAINLTPLIAAAPSLHRAAAAIAVAQAKIDGLPHHTWLAKVDRARASAATQLSSVGSYVDTADRVAQVLPPMAGADGPKRYFVGLQNEAEMRGTGGLPGVFAILVADHGTFTFTHFESDAMLGSNTTDAKVQTSENFGAAYNESWGTSDPTGLYVNSNLSPNFPYAAATWAAMWQRISGEHVDGALALDPTALGYLLNVTGPATMPDGRSVTGDNVVALTEKDAYSLYPNYAKRKAFLLSLVAAVDRKVFTGGGNPQALVQAFGKAAGQRRLLLWSSNPASEALLKQIPLSGAIPDSAAPFSGVIVNNVAGGKLDYYLSRSATVNSSGCGSTREVEATIALTNNAPAQGLPQYVSERLDSHAKQAKPGDNRVWLDYLATDGAQLLGATLNGAPITVQVHSEVGHPDYRYDLELPRGSTQTLVLRLREPATPGTPRVWRQPGVTAINYVYQDQNCGPSTN